MLRSITLRNFKAFGKKTKIPLSGLTILSGPNNSGKSSILHSLLLLKQTHEHPGNFPLCSLGRYGSFGSFRDLAHTPTDHWLDISLDFHLPNEMPFEIAKDVFAIKSRLKKGPRVATDATLSLRFGEDLKSECGFRLGRSSLSLSISGSKLKPTISWSAKKLLKAEGARTNPKPPGTDLHLSNFFPSHIEIRGGGNYQIVNFPGVFRGSLSTLAGTMHDILYLGPLREDPHRYYVMDKEFVSDIGVRGEHTWNALAYAPVKRIKFYDPRKNRFRNASLVEGINWWLKYFGIASQIRAERSAGDPIYKIKLKGDYSGDRSIVEVGFGVSQILPILVLGLMAHNDAILLFEQPEIHIHPAIQAKLADFFIALSKAGKQVVVETHSEHIINRMRTRILEGTLSLDKTSILFIQKDSKHNTCIQKIKFGSDGQISNWPNGFFDTHVAEVRAQNDALMRRFQRNTN